MKKGILIVLVLVVPILIYVLLRSGRNIYKPLPVYGPKEVASTFKVVKGKKIADTTFYTVKPYPLGNDSLIHVAAFLFTNDSSLNKNLNKCMARLVRRYDLNPEIKFVTYSAYPDALVDSSKTDRWLVINLPKDSLQALAKHYLLNDAKGDSVSNVRFVLVDRLRRIRGYYNMQQTKSIDTLMDEVKVATVEALREKGKLN